MTASSDDDPLAEHLPGFLLPAYDRYRAFDAARDHWGPTVVTYVELLVAIALTVGFGYWVYLYLLTG